MYKLAVHTHSHSIGALPDTRPWQALACLHALNNSIAFKIASGRASPPALATQGHLAAKRLGIAGSARHTITNLSAATARVLVFPFPLLQRLSPFLARCLPPGHKHYTNAHVPRASHQPRPQPPPLALLSAHGLPFLKRASSPRPAGPAIKFGTQASGTSAAPPTQGTDGTCWCLIYLPPTPCHCPPPQGPQMHRPPRSTQQGRRRRQPLRQRRRSRPSSRSGP